MNDIHTATVTRVYYKLQKKNLFHKTLSFIKQNSNKQKKLRRLSAKNDVSFDILTKTTKRNNNL